VYFRISDITLFRTMTDPIAQRPYSTLAIQNNICSPFESDERSSRGQITMVDLTQGNGTVLRLAVKPIDQSKVQLPASDSRRVLYTHPYALADLDDARRSILQFVTGSVVPYVKAKVASADELSWNVFAEACRCVERERVSMKVKF